ncbi:MAG TPA: nucleotidyltransferase domain-containing protein [Gaiellaceae bacterium]|nr:nucleotidyltransferase domain-containing protein [Gaiellaceae bacterium]
MATARTEELRALAQRVADELPAESAVEIVLTGSVSRGAADELSDIEMLVVSPERLELGECFRLVGAAGLAGLDTWGPPDTPARRVFGYRDAVPVETVWWDRSYAESRVDALLTGDTPSTADALVHGVSLRSAGLLAAWQARLRAYPPELASARIEEAALRWCGYAPAGLLTILRPGDSLALAEWLVDAATRVLVIVYAVNRVWQPTTKRLDDRLRDLDVQPDRLAERIGASLAEPDSRRALRLMTELQAEALALAPSGPNVERARVWTAEALVLLR